MLSIHSFSLQRILKLFVCLLVCKITFGVLLSYSEYMPADFESEFLHGRERYFSGAYSWAFYTHITSGPCSLVCGMILISEQFRLRFSTWHRILGRIQVACILLLVTPSGLWMSCYTESGPLAGAGFATLAFLTATCTVFGWQSAVTRRFAQHRCWMSRCFILLCSAIVLRLMGGLATVAGIDAAWPYPLAAWTSWMLPLLAYELSLRKPFRTRMTLE